MISVEGTLNPQNQQLLTALGEYKDQVTTRLVRSQTPAEVVLQNLSQAVTVLPADVRPNFEDRKMASFTASVITPNQHPLGESFGFFFLPGVLGTAPSTAHIAGEFYREASDRLDKPVMFSSSFSSSIGVDMRKQPFIGNTTKRAAFQAGLMAEILRKNPATEIWLMGHSDGGLSALHTLPILEQLMKDRDSETRIAGLILTQATGLYDQNILSFGLRYSRMPLMNEAIAYLYPTSKQLLDASERLATESDPKLKKALNNELTRIQSRYFIERPGHLKAEILKTLMGADTRVGREGWREALQIIRSTPEWLRAAPESIRRLVNVPVGIQWGERDPNFPPELAGRAVTKDTFPNTSQFISGTLINWPHWGVAINAAQYAQMTLSMIQKMSETKQAEVHLYL